jgi:hypothetical protein
MMTDINAFQSLSSLPPLDLDGSNWPIFRQKFTWYIKSLGLEDHLDKDLYPEPLEAKPTSQANKLTEAYQVCLEEWLKKKQEWTKENKDWKKDNSKAKSALGRVLPNSLLLECQSHNNFVDMWKFLQAHFQKTSHA